MIEPRKIGYKYLALRIYGTVKLIYSYFGFWSQSGF